MNRCYPALQRLLVASALLLLAALLPPGARANEGAYEQVLPIIFSALPGVLVVEDVKAGLRAAIEAANAAGQLPRIELAADIILSAPLPALDHPGGGTAVIAGNDHTLDGSRARFCAAHRCGRRRDRTTDAQSPGSGREYAVCGGGIFSAGHLTLRQMRLVDNWARWGGGICIQSLGASTAGAGSGSIHRERQHRL